MRGTMAAVVCCVVMMLAAASPAVVHGHQGHLTKSSAYDRAASAAAIAAWNASGLVGATLKKRVTGADLDTSRRWHVAGTDLGIPYVLENGAIGFIFGDTFSTAWPESPNNDWRAPVMLRSAVHPGAPSGIVFDSAAKVRGDGRAPEILNICAHNWPGGNWPNDEISCIPNDGISFPETKRQIISFQSINRWDPSPWRSRYATLAYTDNGNDFTRVPGLAWWNNEANTDPFQMWTMQRDGDWVYVFTVRSGRQWGPMMLQRVSWKSMFTKEAYQGWGWDGHSWGWGRPPTPILEGAFGEPSVKKLGNGTWAMVYLNCVTDIIVSRTATGPDQAWSPEKIQLTPLQEQNLYGGFIHPWSSTKPNDFHLMVSRWSHDGAGHSTAYHVDQYYSSV